MRTIDLGTHSAYGVAANKDRIAVRLNYVNMKHSDVDVFDFTGRKIATHLPSKSIVDIHSNAISIDPDNTIWLPSPHGDVRVRQGRSVEPSRNKSLVESFCTSQYAGPGKRWVLSQNGKLMVVDETGKKVGSTNPPKTKMHFVEMFDSAPDGSVVASVQHGNGKFFVELYDATGRLIHSWPIPEWKERTNDEISYDGKQVMLIRTDGLYGLSTTGKRLWYLPLTTATPQKTPKGAMKVVWSSIQATLADGADAIITGDVGQARDLFEGTKHYKVKIYRLPPVE